jgi:hypothetical protein
MVLASIGSIKIDILPLYEVAYKLVERLTELNVDITYLKDQNNIDESFDLYIEEMKADPETFYKHIIQDYQRGKFGKYILDYKIS